MLPYGLSAAVGLAVGILYGLLGVRSPAPPVIALLGLLGMLVGEQAVALGRRMLAGEPVTAAWVRQSCAPHMSGALPPQPDPAAPSPEDGTPTAKG